MFPFKIGLLDRRLYALHLRRWAQAAGRAASADLATLRRQRIRARYLKAHLDRLLHTADERLALPRIGRLGMAAGSVAWPLADARRQRRPNEIRYGGRGHPVS